MANGTAMRGKLSVAILAAGKGTRMRNAVPKVLHPLAGRSLIAHVLECAGRLDAARTVVVLGAGMEAVEAEVRREAPGAAIAIQEPQLGTGHALEVALPHLAEEGSVLVLYGDTPLIAASTLEELIELRKQSDAALAVLGMRPPDPTGYGRLRLDGSGRLFEIVEDRHASEALKRDALCNSGVMAIDAGRLPDLVKAIGLRPEKQEYYLTDAVAAAVERGWMCLARECSYEEGHGVNSQAQLAEAEAFFQERKRAELLEAGVIMPAPQTVFLAADTVAAPGVLIEPFVVFGPGVRLEADARVLAHSHLEGASVAAGAVVGPFARLRPGTRIGEGARIGNFVEAKNAHVADGAKANHLSYLGDCSIGADANVGAGTITCNYDGFAKNRTEIGAHAFIGSNTALVAPVRVGDAAIVGAGSVIVRDVPDNAVAVARGGQINHPDRAEAVRTRQMTKRGARSG